MMPFTKTCTRCGGDPKPLEAFPFERGRYRPECTACKRARSLRLYHDKPLRPRDTPQADALTVTLKGWHVPTWSVWHGRQAV